MLESQLPQDLEEIEDDDQYYKILFGDPREQSATSLYATTPENQNELKPDDEFAGEEAIFNMHSKFRKYRRIKEKDTLEGIQAHFPLVEFLDATDHRKILPKSIGLINKKADVGDKYPLESVKTVFIGKDYAEPFSEALKVINKVKELDLSYSDLHNEMLLPILEKVPLSLESLIVSHNYNFTPKVYKWLGSLLEDNQRV